MIREDDFPLIGEAPDPAKGRAVVALLRDRRGRHLLQLRDDFEGVPGRGTWSLFGGGMEPGETLSEALIREVAEEIGVRLVAADLRPFGWLQGTRARIFVFDCVRAVEPEEVTLREGAGFGFFTAAQCRDLVPSPLLKRLNPVYFQRLED